MNQAKFLLAFDFKNGCGKAFVLHCHVSVLAFDHDVLCYWEGSMDNHRTDRGQDFPIFVLWYESGKFDCVQVIARY